MSDDVNTLYFGGGTPSVLPLSVFRRIREALDAAGHGGPYEEFTVEVNPDDIVEKGPEYVEGLLELGVNRISMGVQSFDDSILRWMNRRHDSAAARKAYSILESAGVGNISIDLIFGLPQLSDGQWRDTLRQALEISSSGGLPQHISSYQLSVEPGSALAGMVARGVWSEASEDLCARQYEILCHELSAAGYNHYEISNFARPGYEAVHNSAYWKHLPYIGLGPGAHSFIPGLTEEGSERVVREWNNPDLQAYIDAASESCFASVRDFEELTAEQLVLEHIMLGLRTSEGVDEDYLRAHCNLPALSKAIASADLVPSGTDTVNPRLRIPESRFFVSDSIISELV
jgi:oxygen-independent coproporphyrinogen-3 oxidase